MPSPLFTAAILCYNRRDMVRLAIESALAQEFRDFELIVVDDCSTDGSREVLAEYADRARIVLRDQNGGEMASRNTAIEHAAGEYIAFLDSDDAWYPWTLSVFEQAIREHERPTIVGGKQFPFTDEARIGDAPREPARFTTHANYFAADLYLGVMTCAIRRDAIQAVGGFNPARLNCLDSDLLFRIGDRPGMVCVEAPATLAFRDHAGIMKNTKLSYGGAVHLIDSERRGAYPGGDALRADRLKHLLIRMRAISAMCVNSGSHRHGWGLYRKTFLWNLTAGRLRYLTMFPLLSLYRLVAGPVSR